MIVGVLKVMKSEEYRNCMTPAVAEVMTVNGDTIKVEQNGGFGSELLVP